jgi:pimeloyl-ACP methyl ester carboxylesterase
LIAALEAIRDREDSTEFVRSFERPVEFVVGEHEQFVTAGELFEFDVREVPDSGHLVNIERPDAFNAVLQEFLVRV